MKISKFTPPIEERDTEELIAIAHSCEEFWQQEAIDLAKKELLNRNVPMEYQLELFAKWDAEYEHYRKIWEKQLKENETKKYTAIEQWIIFFISPLILLGKINIDMSITDLKNENFKEKVKQRQTALIAGALFYILSFYFLLKL